MGVKFTNDMLYIIYTEKYLENSIPFIKIEAKYIRKVKSIIEQYVKAISNE